MHTSRLTLGSLTLAALALGMPAGPARAQPAAPCAAYVEAFGRGATAFAAGDTLGARSAWADAARATVCGPDAAFNLATVALGRGEWGEAERRYSEALVRMDAWADSSAARAGLRRLERAALDGLFAVGSERLRADSAHAAARVFAGLVARDPLLREAHHALAFALYRLERWADLVPAARRALAFDPLSYNAHVLLYNAYRGREDGPNARAALDAVNALPIDVRGVELLPAPGGQRLAGTVAGRAAPAGTPVRVAFTLLSPSGEIATQETTLASPGPGDSVPFTVVFPAGGATAYRYRVLDAALPGNP